MSLRFYFGGSGAGKSTKLYNELIKRSMAEPKRNFLVIVPDQFTMQTQKELVTMHERGGIMNIDVLSFGRLSHRIFEEVGGNETPVLDDTGKSLVLRKVAANLKDELPVLGGNLDRQGYIHEVKSAISEFMQYGIAPSDVQELISYAEKRGALKAKLKDLEVLYKGFKEYIKEQFITTEETLDLLQKALHRSKIIPGSVIVFDGFTGFTPIQNRVIGELMTLAEEVIVTITVDVENSTTPWLLRGEQELFYLERKTAKDLCKIAETLHAPRGEDVYLTGEEGKCRFKPGSALGHLEKSLFRYPVKKYTGAQDEIFIFEASTIREEVRQMALCLEGLVRDKNYCYRDIAVVCGDLGSYGEHVENEFALLGIPCYVDRTRGIVLNPFVEYIKSALKMLEKDFSYETVFQYLRSGMTGFSMREVDVLENYVRESGMRGRKKWNQPFTLKTDGRATEEQKEFELEKITALNGIRERLLEQMAPLLQLQKQETAKVYVEALYQFLLEAGTAEKLAAYEERFKEEGNLTLAKEYGQIYRLVMELLNQVIGLLGEEVMTLKEFADILEAGFGEIEVGTIPQNVDRVLVGDMERTRLKEVKVLFFVGVNDGNIPKAAGKGGIISDIDREFLTGSKLELAPSPRQQMYTQRLYLYLNMTKPSERLYLSYAKLSGDGNSIRPAYLIDTICGMYKDLSVSHPEQRPWYEQIVTPASGMKYLASGLRDYVAGVPAQQDVMTLYHLYKREAVEKPEEFGGRLIETILGAAFMRYEDRSLGRELARRLYGQILQSSVSRLETYAACAYSHFLKYGLTLKERKEFGFESVDMGNVFHGVLELFAQKLEESGYTWFNFPEQFGEKAVAEAMEMVSAGYGNTVLYSSARNEYAVKRMQRILQRAVKTIQYQLRKGMFVPGSYELSFSKVSDLNSINIALSEEEKIRLRGRIDRVDICDLDDRLYVKIVDYKSGQKKFDVVALYYGLQLQLVVYMNAAVEAEKRKHPEKEVIPAAMFYYHVADPVIESASPLSEEELNQRLIADLRVAGVINERDDVVKKLDDIAEGKSDVAPFEYKKDGSLTANSATLAEEDWKDISSYVNLKIKNIGREILDGTISVSPYTDGTKDSCTYCAYKEVCGFDPSMRGYKKRILGGMKKEDVLSEIRKEVSGNGN